MQLQTTNNQPSKVVQKFLNHENEDWIIVFNDGSTKEITFEQANQIFKLSGEPNQAGIRIDGGFYRFSSFAKIIPLSEYYYEYPEKRPPIINKNYPPIPKDPNQINRVLSPIQQKEKRKRALESMKRGLLNYINSSEYQGTEAPKRLLNKIEYKLKTI